MHTVVSYFERQWIVFKAGSKVTFRCLVELFYWFTGIYYLKSRGAGEMTVPTFKEWEIFVKEYFSSSYLLYKTEIKRLVVVPCVQNIWFNNPNECVTINETDGIRTRNLCRDRAVL